MWPDQISLDPAFYPENFHLSIPTDGTGLFHGGTNIPSYF
jgi:hypothetical protein